MWAFRIVALVAVPLLLLVVVEAILRLAGTGYPTAFFLPYKEEGQKLLIDNPQFTWRYFPQEIARRSTSIRIDESKKPGTVRVFILGESAVMGDPAEEYGICRVIDVVLEHDYPGTRFEVVNAGITAINSFVIRDIASDCARQKPDLFITYIGNNEVLGPYGPGTVLTPIMKNRAAILFQTWLKRLKISQAIETIARSRDDKKDAPKWNGLELFAKNHFSSRSPEMEMVRE
ncbi:MAG: hypothetical protein ABI579_04940, partial [Candidatus Sumerlaeota bacterium]